MHNKIIRGDLKPECLRNETLADILTATAKRIPKKTALIFEGSSITYEELNYRANIVAHHLISMGVVPGDLIGLWLPRGIDLLVMQAGIAKSGAGFLPFDAQIPIDRIAICLTDAKAKYLLVHADWTPNTSTLDVPSISHTALQKQLENKQTLLTPTNFLPNHPAYVIYTSGSTGKPKGILLSQKNICHLLRSENEIIKIQESDRVYHGFSVAFDMSFEEIWISYLAGATIWIAPKELTIDPVELPKILQKEKITVLHAVPTLVSLFNEDIPTLRLMNLGGEMCPQSLVDKWAQKNIQIFNSYGPTETTVTASLARLFPNQKVTIGAPLPNYGMLILNEEGEILPRNETGELCIFGPGVALGYLGLPELTATKFIQNKYAGNEDESILYRSGDLAFIDDNGQVHCLGRVDDQVKIRGFRVELGEIEAALCAQNNVSTAAVILSKQNDIEFLIAYLIPDLSSRGLTAGSSLDPAVKPRGDMQAISGLRSALQSQLPFYMVPSHFVWLDEMPRLSSGKIDRKFLKTQSLSLKTEAGSAFTPENIGQELLLANIRPLFPGLDLTLESDFFNDLGGHSLLAARLVSGLRKDPRCENLSIQQVYQYRTLGTLAEFIQNLMQSESTNKVNKDNLKAIPSRFRRISCGLVQAAIIPFLVCLRVLHWALPFFAYHYMTGDPVDSLFVAAGVAVLVFFYAQFFMFFAVIIGRWFLLLGVKPGRYPLWGFTYLRWWTADRLQDVAPLHLLAGSPYYTLYLRGLGAKVGKDVNISSVRVRFPSAVTIGDGVTIASAVNIENAYVANSELVLGTCVIGKNSHIGAYSIVEGDTVINENAYLSGLSSLAENQSIPSYEYWDGSPAKKTKEYKPSARPPAPKFTQKVFEALFFSGGALFVGMLFFLPIFPAFMIIDKLDRLGFHPTYNHNILLTAMQYFVLALPASAVLIVITAIATRLVRQILVPKIYAGTYSVHSKTYYCKWLVNQIQESSLNVLHGVFATVYSPFWFRILGARVGKRAEISNAIGLVPELLTLGDETFIADAVVLGSEEINNGWMTLTATTVGNRSFVGNGAYVPNGTVLPENVLIGVQSKPPENDSLKNGDTWMGTPSLKLPARETIEGFPESLTFNPSFSRQISRAIVEGFRIVLPLAIIIAGAYSIINYAMPKTPNYAIHHWFWTLTHLSYAGVIYGIGSFALICGLKWLVIGRYKTSATPMWSAFIWKSEAITSLYESVSVINCLVFLRGTPWLPSALRLMGCHIGRDVYMDTTNVTEFDCVNIGNACEINNRCGLQTHLFEDRIMKIGHVMVGSNVTMRSRSVVLYSATVQDGAYLGPLTLVLKGESIPAHSMWTGTPSEPWIITPVA